MKNNITLFKESLQKGEFYGSYFMNKIIITVSFDF